ncbi:MAG: hypothetical protein EOM92_22620 [Gammaproteobacteria bacterium]|jgi:hypothetical protein|nr:hypothetical protein [Gammaproteobacteria bacterium]
MKSFKEYNKKENPFLNWESSFNERRNLNRQKVNEEITRPPVRANYDNYQFRNDKNHPVHDTLAIKGREELSPEEINSVQHYTGTSAKNTETGHLSSGEMNGYLRNRFGHKFSKIKYGHAPDKVEEGIKNLSKAFRPSTTNSVPIETFSGIPNEIGYKLEQMNPGETTHLPGFTSTSTNRKVAERFSNYDDLGIRPGHLIKFHVHPGAGLSIARHSVSLEDENEEPDETTKLFTQLYGETGKGNQGEDEILLHHGTKVTYLGSERQGRHIIHHMEAHPEHLSLDEYPNPYLHPKI